MSGPRLDRQIRVFVSSTFRDMHDEREELVKRVFPQLRKLCESRGVVWGEVDLRWGVTDEQKAEGKVLPICLAEIKRCRPYFIGILGERYGWVPDEIPQELIEREDWLKEHRDHSVTELEILHGVLRNPDMAEHAFFYFRDPAYADKPDFRSEDDASGKKLADLKDRIRRSGFPVRENYPDPHTLGEMVLQDFTQLIDRLFPDVPLDPLDRDAADHEAFARSRARVYIGRQEYFNRLDEHSSGDGPPLVILGESGSGKSALMANWAMRYRESHPDDLLIQHFIGASPYSADWAAMLRRIMGEFKRRFDIRQDIPDKPDELRMAFANWLHMAAAKGRVVLVLDALNQLEDRDGAPDLVWLPPVIPANVRLILSTLPGRPLDDLTKRQWPTLNIEPFTEVERAKFIVEYLAQYTKALSSTRAEKIASASQSANPLYLKALLEELRLFGEHEKLDQRIGHYLEADTVPELYEKILVRYEEDYEQERPGLVRDAMAFIWAARRGLSEAELLDILGKDGEPLPRAVWSPLHLAAEQALVNRSGLIGFFHDYLREAVGNAYVSTGEKRCEAHLRLALYFPTRELGLRKLDELPWQLAEAGAWRRLCVLLTEPSFFKSLWDAKQFDLKAYWARLEENAVSMVDAYRAILDAPEASEDPDHVRCIGLLLAAAGHPSAALCLQTYLVEHYQRAGDNQRLQGCLGDKGLVLEDLGDPAGAMSLHKEQERISRILGDEGSLRTSLINQGVVRYHQGDFTAALALYKEAEVLSREHGDLYILQACLGDQGAVLYDIGELEHALELYAEQEHICRAIGNSEALQSCLGNQGVIWDLRGHQDRAMALFQEQEKICRELGDKAWLQLSLGNQGNVLSARGDLDAAMALYKEREDICRKTDDQRGLQASLGGQASVLHAHDDLDGAMALFKEQARICLQLGNRDGLQESLGNQGGILADRGDLNGAMALYKEQEHICRELGKKDNLQTSLGRQGQILYLLGDPEGAKALYREEERICRELGHMNGLQASLGNQGLILRDQDDLDGAMVLYKEQERICRELGNKNDLGGCLGNQGNVFRARGDLDRAMALYREEERVCRDVRDNKGLAHSLCHQALLLTDQGQLAKGLHLAHESYRMALDCGYSALAERIRPILDQLRSCTDVGGVLAPAEEEELKHREVGYHEGVAKSLAQQAELLAKMGRVSEAMEKKAEAIRTATDNGLHTLAEQIKKMLDPLLPD